MKNIKWVLFLTIIVMTFGCGETGTKTANSSTTNSNAGNANTAAAPAKDIKTTITELENGAYEAWKKKDGKFFEEFLADNYVGVGMTGRGGKEDSVKGISEFPCEVNSTSTSDEDTVELADGVVLFTVKDTSVAECEGKAMPGPMWAATVYVKDGENWKAAYHQVAPSAETKGENPPAPKDAPKPKPMEDANKEITAKLSEIDKGLWDAWSKGEGKIFEETLTKDYRRLVPWGRQDREQTIKTITEQDCKVKSMAHDDFSTTKFSDGVAMLTYKTDVDATCDGDALAKQYWSSVIYTKDGDKWLSAFFAATPAS